MKTRFFEVTNGFNWGKFLVAEFDPDEWSRRAILDAAEQLPLVAGRGWGREHIFVMDLQTGEGALFRHGGSASHDVQNRHNIWRCPMFVPFLTWLYTQPVDKLMELPQLIHLTEDEAPSSMLGKRGDGSEPIQS